MTSIPARSRALLLGLAALVLSGCSSTANKAYYGFWDTLGYEKRDLMVSEVKDARTEQEKAKEQFKTTLERFQAITGTSGGDLEAQYKKLSSDYDRCDSRAKAVSKQIADVESVSNDMFKEWETELATISNPSYRSQSQQMLNDTKSRYKGVIGAMRQSEASMQPVLTAFNDQVLFLKHNLNAQAIASLDSTKVQIQSNVDQLVKEMERSIAETDAFIAQLESQNKKS